MAEFIAGGRTVPAENGWKWIVEGWNLFMRQPGIWIAQAVILFVILTALAFIPVVGSLAGIVLGEVFVGGLILGCRALDEGGKLEIGHLFAGFRERFGTLVSIGLLYLAGMVMCALITGLIVGFKLFRLLGSAETDLAALLAAGMTLLLGALIFLALILPVVMATWFAPALVVFHKLGAIEALKASFAGCLKNVVPFLVYGLILLIPAIVASIPLMLGWLVLTPVLIATVYTAYRDIYFS